MAFTSKIKSSLSSFSLGRDETIPEKKTESLDKIDNRDISPKLTKTELNKLAKSYPSWLRDNSGVKNLPAIYKGVLGQVQVHPIINLDKNKMSKFDRLANHNIEYLNRYTDTQRVHQLLLASQLPNDLLAIIWAHVNKSFPGKLTNREVCLALALIAIFQRCKSDADRKDLLFGPNKKDLFQLVKDERNPPIPKLHATNSEVRQAIDKTSNYFLENGKTFGNPNDRNDIGLLVDLNSESFEKLNLNTQSPFKISIKAPPYTTPKNDLASTADLTFINTNWLNKYITDLMDMKIGEFEKNVSYKFTIWSEILLAIKRIFKKTFDTLSVNHSRQSAVESLTSPEGIVFIKHISLLYPLAHNIKLTINNINVLDKLQKPSDASNYDGHDDMMDKTFLKFVDELTTSINEYWAVLINLFHECGQTRYIEYIMDGLNKPTVIDTNSHLTLEEIAAIIDTRDKIEICSICHMNEFILAKDYSPNESAKQEIDQSISNDIVSLIDNELITIDNYYYYHAKCGSFWLNNVSNDNSLPWEDSKEISNILLPTKCD